MQILNYLPNFRLLNNRHLALYSGGFLTVLGASLFFYKYKKQVLYYLVLGKKRGTGFFRTTQSNPTDCKN